MKTRKLRLKEVKDLDHHETSENIRTKDSYLALLNYCLFHVL